MWPGTIMCLQTKPYAPALAVVACALGSRVQWHQSGTCTIASMHLWQWSPKVAATPHGDVLAGEVHGSSRPSLSFSSSLPTGLQTSLVCIIWVTRWTAVESCESLVFFWELNNDVQKCLRKDLINTKEQDIRRILSAVFYVFPGVEWWCPRMLI